MKTVAILVIVLVIFVAVLGLTAGQTAVGRYYDNQAQPGSAVDAVMRSRQTPPVAPEASGRWVAILFPLAMLTMVGVIIGLLFYGERFAKQWRLLKKKGRTHAVSPLPYYQQQQQPDWQQAPTVRQIPAPRDESEIELY